MPGSSRSSRRSRSSSTCSTGRSTNTPKWNTISISGYHIREAGSTAAQELAFTLANGFSYVEHGVARGLDVDSFAPRLSFFWDVHNDFFEEIAKMRAARRIWARTMRQKYGAKNPRSWQMRFHCQTAGVTLTAQQPLNNIVRVAYQALAAVLGGTQSLHTNALDETLALPDRGIGAGRAAHPADPRLRNRRAQRLRPAGRVVLRRGADRQPGARSRRAVRGDRGPGRSGSGHRVGLVPAADRPVRVAFPGRSGAGTQSGGWGEPVPEEDEAPPGHSPDWRRGGADSAGTDGGAPGDSGRRAGRAAARSALGAAAVSDQNVIPAMLDCARAYCTLFEIRHVLETVYGTYREPVFF